jgi:hypothetical protein
MQVEKLDDILVRCPMPGKEGLEPERLGDFMQTEVGQRVLGQALENVAVLVESGMDEEQAATIALGPAALHDEDGRLMRAPQPEAAIFIEQPSESKKK